MDPIKSTIIDPMIGLYLKPWIYKTSVDVIYNIYTIQENCRGDIFRMEV